MIIETVILGAVVAATGVCIGLFLSLALKERKELSAPDDVRAVAAVLMRASSQQTNGGYPRLEIKDLACESWLFQPEEISSNSYLLLLPPRESRAPNIPPLESRFQPYLRAELMQEAT